jgi:hypothetical protein
MPDNRCDHSEQNSTVMEVLLRWFLFLTMLTILALATTQPAHAADALGKATGTPVNCDAVRGTAGVPGGTCYILNISCPGIADISTGLKVNSPQGPSVGTVLFSTGGGGIIWYDQHFTYGAVAVEDVLNAGYTTAQFNFMFPPSNFHHGQVAGWLTGPGGPRALACRWATAAQWVHDHIRQPDTPFCATGNSGGSGAAAYAIAHYGMGSEFTMLEQTGGPPFTRIDNGCLCNTAAVQTPCGQGALSTCYQKEAQQFIDPAYGNSSCSSAELTHGSRNAGQFLNDSIASPDATTSYPNTDIHFVFGGLDDGSAVPQGMIWESGITPKNPPVVECVADAGHRVPDVLDGAKKIASDLIAYCR